MNKQRLQEKYENEVAKKLVSDFSIKNKMAIPALTKVVVNVGIGKSMKSKEVVENLKKDLAVITGQIPSVRPAKISVSNFGLRAGMPVGLTVTLRRERMYSFLDRLFSIVLPRLRDFRGVAITSFDSQGNYTLGVREHTVFPEVEGARMTNPHGMEITIVTNTKDVAQARALLTLLGMPFVKEDQDGNNS